MRDRYCAAKKNGLSPVSFDADFDLTPGGRREPGIDGMVRSV
ncbi:MAG: hypothetical protein PHP59_02475 [Methanofollis sp.]|nr:hypothetical protein [Methanofollis sp.]MDD4254223.1 hypothetical protein [Methanofollis sp.]